MKRILAGLSLLVLTACSTMSGVFGSTGFKEEKLTATRYRISYTAPADTKTSLIADRTLARAAQLTLDKGQEWFEVDGKIDTDNGQTLVIVMGSGETLAGGASKAYDAKQTLNRLKDKVS